jgi:hypothetical protein
MTEPAWFYIPLRVHVQARTLGGMDGIRGRYRETWTFAAIWQKPASFMVALVPIVSGDFDGLLCGCFFLRARAPGWENGCCLNLMLLLYIPLLLYDRALVYKYFYRIFERLFGIAVLCDIATASRYFAYNHVAFDLTFHRLPDE